VKFLSSIKGVKPFLYAVAIEVLGYWLYLQIQ
jgi:hypothetical protein